MQHNIRRYLSETNTEPCPHCVEGSGKAKGHSGTHRHHVEAPKHRRSHKKRKTPPPQVATDAMGGGQASKKKRKGSF